MPAAKAPKAPDPATLKMPHTALEARMAIEALTAAEAADILRNGQDAWARSTMRRGGTMRSRGMHAVDMGGWWWPVLFLELAAKRGGVSHARIVSIGQAPRKDAELQAREPWIVRSFLALKDLGVFMGRKGENPGLVNGDDA